jgi:predicted RNase H-like HicB family nuclease
MAACAIVVEQLSDGRFRAACTLFPDCEAIASTADAARQAVEEAIGWHVRRQLGEAGSPASEFQLPPRASGEGESHHVS